MERTLPAVASLSANPGATKTTNGSYAVFTFTTSGTFTVAQAGYASVLIVGGGGYGGTDVGPPGGGGGLIYFDLATKPMSLTAQAYTVTVGTGGIGGSSKSLATDSVFNNYRAKAGGSGGGNGSLSTTGGSCSGCPGLSGGASTSQTAPNQTIYSDAYYIGSNVGGKGSTANYYLTGGGGGAGGVGGDASQPNAGIGGPGYACNITGSSVYYAAGGGGAPDGYRAGLSVASAGGTGGGGAGGGGNASGYGCGGGGGYGGGSYGGNGSNGVVIILCLSTA